MVPWATRVTDQHSSHVKADQTSQKAFHYNNGCLPFGVTTSRGITGSRWIIVSVSQDPFSTDELWFPRALMNLDLASKALWCTKTSLSMSTTSSTETVVSVQGSKKLCEELDFTARWIMWTLWLWGLKCPYVLARVVHCSQRTFAECGDIAYLNNILHLQEFIALLVGESKRIEMSKPL